MLAGVLWLLCGLGAEPPTYSQDIAPILTERCTGCHRAGEAAPMALTTYEETRPWARAILKQVSEGTMPPWHAAGEPGRWVGDTRLTQAEKNLIRDWVRSGAPEGGKLPRPSPLPTGTAWQIGQPDLVFPIPETLVEGEEQTRHFVIQTNLESDVWVEAIEIQPGNRRLVHHANLRTLNVVYVPGEDPESWPAGSAKRLRAGQPLELIIHYGRGKDGERDQTRIGLRLAKVKVQREIQLLTLEREDFSIPPQVADYRLAVSAKLPGAAQLLSFNVEMRYRGKAARIIAGDAVLFDLPRYEYEWQRKYTLSQPLTLPASTALSMEAIYDNSANYRSNPDPAKSVGPPEEVLRAVVEYVLD